MLQKKHLKNSEDDEIIVSENMHRKAVLEYYKLPIAALKENFQVAETKFSNAEEAERDAATEEFKDTEELLKRGRKAVDDANEKLFLKKIELAVVKSILDDIKKSEEQRIKVDHNS